MRIMFHPHLIFLANIMKQLILLSLLKPEGKSTLWGEAKKMNMRAYSTTSRFGVLHFWKLDPKYPILKKITQDVLSIPASIIVSESAFSTGGRVLSPHRSSPHCDTGGIDMLTKLDN